MVFKILIIVISIIMMLFGLFYGIFQYVNEDDDVKGTVGIIICVIGILAFAFVPWNIHQVNTGEVAVVRKLGVIEETRTAGVYWDNMFTKKYEKYDTKVQQVEIKTPAYSKDGQTLELEVVIQYQIQQENVDKIAAIYGGLDRLESRIETISIERIKSVLSEKTAMETIETRNVVSADVTLRVSDAISTDYYVNITNVVLTNIDFTDEFEKIVEQKVAAEQEAQKAVNEAAKKETEAQAAKRVAELQADADLYTAQKGAEALLVQAQASADALKLEKAATAEAIQQYVNELGLSAEDAVKLYEYLIWVAAWDGDVPTVTDGGAGYIVVPQP